MHDPVILQLTWAVAVVALIVAVGKPIKDYLRGERKATKEEIVDEAKMSAEYSLYHHLEEQITQYRVVADQAFSERNELVARLGLLEARAEDLIAQKELVEHLKIRLDRKDEEMRQLLQEAAQERKQFLAVINSKDAEIAKRDERILSLEKGQKELEIRLAKEERFVQTFVCPMDTARAQTEPAI